MWTFSVGALEAMWSVGRSLVRVSVPVVVLTSALAGALAGGMPTSVHAQGTGSRAHPTSMGLSAGVDASTVIDATTIRRSGARTLADLLAGRVAGLAVTYPTGVQGMAPHLRMRGAAGMVGASEPLLYVDGMLLSDDQFLLGPRPDGHRPSFGWDLPVSEIESVAIVRGQSAGALMEFGAARGAVLVTTRRPAPRSLRLDSFVDVSSTSEATTFPANYATDGIGGGGPTSDCTLSDQALGNCVASALRSWSPLEQASPFRTTAGLRGGVAASGSLGKGSHRAAASFGRHDGVLAPASEQRLDLAFSYANAPGSRVALAFDARHGRGDRTTLDWESGVVSAGLRGSADDDGLRGYTTDPWLFRDQARPVHARRTTVGGNARWVLRPSWDAEARLGIERYARRTSRDPLGAGAPARATRESWSAEFGVSGAHRVGPARGSLNVRLLGSSTASEDSAGSFGIPGPGGSATQLSSRLSSVGVAAFERVRFGQAGQRSVGAGARVSRMTADGESFGRGTAHLVDAEWDIASETFFPRSRVVSALRLRAAQGTAVDLAPIVGVGDQSLRISNSANFDPVDSPPVVREAEVGVHAGFWGGVLTLDARSFTRTATDAPVIVPLPATSGFAWGLRGGNSFETKGGEVRLAVDRVEVGPVAVNAAFSVSSARDRVTRLGVPEFIVSDPSDPGLLLGLVREGGPLGDLITSEMTWQDTNGDGIIDQTEISIAPGFVRRGATRPTRFVAVSGGIEFGPFSAGAVVDAQRGHARYDMTFERRCGQGVSNCRALHDPSTPLAEQARAVASRYTNQVVGAQRGDFARLRELWLRYTLPGGFSSDRLGEARLTLAGYQLATWTKYEGLDPEIGIPYGSSMLLGTPFGQPLVPTWSLRLEFGR
jgi:hypothetical protein